MTGAIVERRKVEKLTMSEKGRHAFQELGFNETESAELRRKADLLTHLEQYIVRNRLTQAKAARVFGVTQPRVSDLLNGKLSLFSLDELVRMYDATGSRVRLVFEQRSTQEGHVLRRVFQTGLDAVGVLSRAGQIVGRAAANILDPKASRQKGRKRRA